MLFIWSPVHIPNTSSYAFCWPCSLLRCAQTKLLHTFLPIATWHNLISPMPINGMQTPFGLASRGAFLMNLHLPRTAGAFSSRLGLWKLFAEDGMAELPPQSRALEKSLGYRALLCQGNISVFSWFIFTLSRPPRDGTLSTVPAGSLP